MRDASLALFMLIYGNSNSGVHQATDAALPLQEFRPSFPSAIFVETRDSGTCWDELDFRCKTSRQRQPPTIVTWAELHFYDLPLIRPSAFVNSAALGGSIALSCGIGSRLGDSQLPVCPSTAHNRDLGRTALLRLALSPSKWFVNSAAFIAGPLSSANSRPY